MSSTAVISYLPPIDVPRSSESVEHKNNNIQEGKENNMAMKTLVTLKKIDLLGFGDDKVVKGGVTDILVGGKSNEVVQISPNQSGVDKSPNEIVYNFPPNLSVLNINGRMRFELVTVRENGRLQIFMVPYHCSQLVRSPLRNGRVMMWLLKDAHMDLV
ncbi:unnamed protein product [Lactuca saligna]|uniref:Uncharacterized protein n=1 Tax=Lactuca saligna TaxID=75948 RepID=A0AA36ELN0_LACSI|nr:unnamed protein product [Lactuca saligna]